MARVICSVCGHGNIDGATDCEICGTPLAPSPAPARPSAEHDPAAEPTCPTCSAVIPDPSNLVCVECLEPLTPLSTATPTTAGSLPRLRFPDRHLDIPSQGSVLLGRDPDQSPLAEYFAGHDNVSRRHASVGAEADGSVWVRDEYSANGTFVNDRRVPGGQTVPLTAGDRLRMASNVVARIELGEPT